MDRFAKNLELLQKSNAKTALQLSYLSPDDVMFCKTRKGELNLKRIYQGKTYYYHDPLGAKDDAEAWMRRQDLTKAGVFYVYGIGLGYAYEAVKPWLKAHRDNTLIFLEDDLAVYHRFLETELATEVLKNPQVKIEASPRLLNDTALFDELSWTFLRVPFVIAALPLYAAVKNDYFLALHHQIAYLAASKAAQVSEYFEYGIAFFRNFYPNLFLLPQASLGNGLFGQFQDVPAIICGAGPSLNKNIDLLSKVGDRAIIFAGGSALNAFCAKGIKPHFGAGIDPNAMQYERIKANQQFKIPFFYRNRFYHDALKAVRGPHLYLTGSGGYDTARWVEEQLGIEGDDVDEGHNIVNFSLSIAHAMGCNPIIFVGVDMAYTDMQSYADGIVPNPQVKKKEILETADFDSQAILRKDIFGKPVYTLWKWVSESQWISDYARQHQDVAFLNATEGGIGFDGIPNLPLSEVMDTLLTQNLPLHKKISDLIETHRLNHVTKDKIASVLEELRDSLIRVTQCIEAIMAEAANMSARIRKEGPLATLETPTMSLYEMELTDEPGYKYLLDNFNIVYLKAFQRELQKVPKRLSEKQQQLRKLELHLKRLSFLKDVSKVNIEMIQLVTRPSCTR